MLRLSLRTWLLILAPAMLILSCSDNSSTGPRPVNNKLPAPSMGGWALPRGLQSPSEPKMQKVAAAATMALGRGWIDQWFVKKSGWTKYEGDWSWWTASPKDKRGWSTAAADSLAYKFYSPLVMDTVYWSWKRTTAGDEWRIVAWNGGTFRDVILAAHSADSSDGWARFLPAVATDGTSLRDWYSWEWNTALNGNFTMAFEAVVDTVQNGSPRAVVASFELDYFPDNHGSVALAAPSGSPYLVRWIVNWTVTGSLSSWIYENKSGSAPNWTDFGDDWDSDWRGGWELFSDDTYDDWAAFWE